MPTPLKLTPDLVSLVIDRTARGETLTSIAKDLDFHPSAWKQRVASDEAVRVAYELAKDHGCEVMIDECLAIADRRPDAIVTYDKDGNSSKRVDTGYVAWAKNRIETRLKLLATWRPEKYGTKAGDTHVTVNVASQEQVHRIGQELRLLRREASGDVL